MWRFLQGIPRYIRCNLNGPIRPQVQQTICRDDEEELVLASAQVVSTSHKKACTQNVFGSYKKWKKWQKENFHYNFWEQQCYHCKFLEAVGWSTALLLSCKLSQLWKIKHRQDDRHGVEPSWMWELYKSIAAEKLALVSYVREDYKLKKVLQKLEKDVTWAKTPPDKKEALVEEEKHSPEKNAQKTHYKSPVEWATTEFPLLWNFPLIADVRNIQNEQEENVSKQATGILEPEKALPDGLEEFSNEWDELCQVYDRIKYNKEGVRFAEQGNYAKAILCWRKAGSKGSAKANFNLGLCYETGTGVSTDIHKAVDYYTKASAAGSAVAAHNLALLYIQGNYSGKKVEPQKIEELLQQAASQGLAEAQTELGVIWHRQGDMIKAAHMFQQAAKQEDSTALYFLGLCHEHGWGVTQNTARAAELYSQASKHNHPNAQFNLANFFEHGSGGLPQDKQAALDLYMESSALGHSPASASALRLSEELNLHQDKDLTNPAKVHLKISVSAPVLSSYLKHHATDLSNLNWEWTLGGESVHKSSTVSNFEKRDSTMDFVNQTEFTLNDCGLSGNDMFDDQETIDSGNPVTFDLGESDSVCDASEVSNAGSLDKYFLLNGGSFGVTLPKTENKQGLMHKSPSYDKLSEMSNESDTSDFSIVFDDSYEGFPLTGIKTGSNNYNGVNDGVNALRSDMRVSGTGGVGGNRFSGFDVFGGTWSEDETSDESNGFLSGSRQVMACN